MANFINLTPHEIVLITSLGDELIIPPSGTVARVTTTTRDFLGEIEGIPVYSQPDNGDAEGLPDPQENTVYIVSGLVAAGCGHRCDVVSPGTGPNDNARRNANGQITGVTRLISSIHCY